MHETDRCSVCGGMLPAGEMTEVCSKCRQNDSTPAENSADREQGSAFAPTIRQASGFLPPTPEALNAHFTQFEVLELLGRGGMGAVYKARQIKLDRLVALKIIHHESANEPAFQERFQREARTLARLNHPHIVAVHDFGEVAESSSPDHPVSGAAWYYFVMEYVEGTNLREMMRTRLSESEAIGIARQICDALQFAHEEGVIHRDIKPENILIDRRGRVKIADFGLAKFTSRTSEEFTLTGTHQVMGTPRYMAPEQMQGTRTVDHRADIYALGVVFYEMLTGELPLGRFDPPSQKADIDPGWDHLILKMLEQSPERRYQTVGEVLRELEALTLGFREPATVQSVPRRRSDSDTIPLVTSSGEVAPETLRRVKWPGIALIVNGFLFLLPAAMLFISGIVGLTHPGYPEQRTVVAILLMTGSLLTCFIVAVVVRGGWHLLTLDQYRPALLASFIGQPAGIWSLSVLSRPEVRSAFRTGDRPLGISRYLLTPLPWIALLALLGIVETFQPWASFRKPAGFLNLDGLIAPPPLVYAAGFGWWQGMTVCFSFAAILLIVVFSAGLEPAPLARPIVLSLVAAAILAVTGHFIMQLRSGDLPVQPLLRAAEWSIERNGVRPSTAREAGISPSLTSAPELISMLTAALYVLIAVDFRRVITARQRPTTLTNREPIDERSLEE